MPYLVRHAHASDKHAWTGPDRLRPLSEPGRREAHGVLTQLRDYPITRILSSPAARCLQTVEPLAQRRRLPVEPDRILGVDADPAALVALLLDPAVGQAVLCSHGELIGRSSSAWSDTTLTMRSSWPGPSGGGRAPATAQPVTIGASRRAALSGPRVLSTRETSRLSRR